MNLANRLTLVRIVLIPLFILAFYYSTRYIAAGVYIIASITDSIDGQIARRRNIVTNFGKIMDPIADKLLLLSALVLLTEYAKIPAIVTIIILGREFLVSGVRMLASASGTVISASWLGKLKAVFQTIAMCALLLDNILFRSIGVPFDEIMLYASLALTVWSGADYIVKNRAVFSTKK